MKKTILIFLIVCHGCSVLPDKQASKDYLFSSQEGLVVHNLWLLSDSTFKYTVTGDLINSESLGRWMVKNKHLYLASYENYKSNFLTIRDLPGKNRDEGNYTFYIKDPDGIPLSAVILTYNNQTLSTNEKGILSFKQANDSLIKASFLGEQYQGYFKKSGQDYKEIIIHQKDNRKTYFENEKWKLKGEKIITASGKILYLHNSGTAR